MGKKEELISLVDEIVKNYCQIIRCMQLMVEKGDKVYEGLDVVETITIFKKDAERWFESRKKLDVIEDEIIDNWDDEELLIDDLIKDRDNTKNTAKLAQDVCKSLYGCYYE